MNQRITRDQAAHVLWHIGVDGGYEPGAFITALLAAFAQADPTNHALLALGFPGESEAMRIAQYRGGEEVLRHIVAGNHVMYMVIGDRLIWNAMHLPEAEL